MKRKYNEKVLDRLRELLRRPEGLTLHFSGGKDSFYLTEHFLKAIKDVKT
jgi:PP-loop superfamily ATP-utilizing enzyme